MHKRKHPEQDLQKACVQMLAIFENQKQLRFFHVPNGGYRSATEAKIFKGLGVRAGVPDLVILPANGQACFIELKADKGNLTENQQDWGEWLEQHYRYAVCRSVDEMLLVLNGWGVTRACAGESMKNETRRDFSGRAPRDSLKSVLCDT